MQKAVLVLFLLATPFMTLQARAADVPKKDVDAAKKDIQKAGKDEVDKIKKAAEESRKAAEAERTKIPNDQNKYLGDRIVFKQKTDGFKRTSVPSPDGKTFTQEETPICIPGGTYLRGIGTNAKGDELLFVADCDWYSFLNVFTGLCGSKSYFCDCSNPDRFAACERDKGRFAEGEKVDALITPGTRIRVETNGLDKAPPNRYGLTYGGLVVPFKFQLTGKKEVKPSASAAPYMGYRFGFESRGIELDAVGFAGLGVVEGKKKETTQTTDGQGQTTTKSDTDTSQLASFSYGFGLIGVIKGGFQFGAVLGFDHAGNGQGFKYNDKPWLALEIGYSWTGASGGSSASNASNTPGS